MRITNEHIETFLQQGVVIIPHFFTAEETRGARAAFDTIYPPYDEWVKRGKPGPNLERRSGHELFPWNDSRLNFLAAHPDVIDAAERLIGTREIRLCDADLSVRYAGDKSDTGFHLDYANNTLGPYLPRDRSNVSFVINLAEITKGTAPTYVIPDGKSDGEGIHMIVPEGSVCIYSSISTRHTSTPFTAPTGYRANMWAIFSRKDRLWDGGRWFTYKGGVPYPQMTRFIVEASPRQLELLGFPPPGDPLWTDEFAAAMARRYPGFDASRYATKAMLAMA